VLLPAADRPVIKQPVASRPRLTGDKCGYAEPDDLYSSAQARSEAINGKDSAIRSLAFQKSGYVW
jgi:hypothetical protein